MRHFFSRRRAEQFARLLDQTTGNGSETMRDTAALSPTDDAAIRYAPEAAVARALSEQSADFAPAPAPQFRQELRAMLIAAAERQGSGDTVAALNEPTRVLPLGVAPTGAARARRRQRGRRTRAAVIVGLAAGTLAVSGISVASGGAMPGDPLYGVKRSSEDARLALAGSDRDKGALYLQFARTRMGEAQAVHDASALADLFMSMDEKTRQATALLTGAALSSRDATVLNPLIQFVNDQRRDLQALARTSAPVKRLTTDSLVLLDLVAARISEVRDGITCHAGYTDDGGTLGPSVATC